jgi:hypothetical protein
MRFNIALALGGVGCGFMVGPSEGLHWGVLNEQPDTCLICATFLPLLPLQHLQHSSISPSAHEGPALGSTGKRLASVAQIALCKSLGHNPNRI